MDGKKFTAKDMQDAYLEGFEDGESHNNIPWKYPPMANAFLISESRKKAAGDPPARLYAVAMSWINAKIDDQKLHELKIEDVTIERGEK